MFSANTSQVSGDALYVEDVFSTYLYSGTTTSQTFNNGLDLSGKGGAVFIKTRTTGTRSTVVFDTNRGTPDKALLTASSTSETTLSNTFTSFNSNGFTIGNDATVYTNGASNRFVSWSFRKAPKFFDVVTYTGSGSNRTIAHSLGSVPGCIIVKRTDTTGNWQVYHRSNANTEYMVLNATDAKATGATRWNSTTPTATEFSLGTDATVNASGGTYVAYLFAHDATSDGIIQCGSFTTDGSSNATVSLGWEPQWVLVKGNSAGQPWITVDQMRGFTVNSSSNVAELYPNSTSAEVTAGGISPTSTGFTANAQLSPSTQYIYIAIRRGPMRTPTSGTSVFNVNISDASGSSTNPEFTSSFPVDSYFFRPRTGTSFAEWIDRLRGLNVWYTQDISAESTYTSEGNLDIQSGAYKGNLSTNYFATMFRRAPSFYDVVCYSGTGSNTTVSHSLGVAPELMIVKRRNGTGAWQVYSAGIANSEYLVLSSTAAKATGTTRWNSTTPGSANFTVGTDATVNASGGTYTAYLFASCPGVSKVGSYTGNGTSQTINCGFAAGARFVMIKRTDSTGDWYVWDSARGIVAGNDPHISMNTTAAEVTTDDSVDTDSSGFVVNQLSATNINVSSATYIYLAVA